jgi:sterol desaturase/sphingolipid hydroxylase (fatty acid hydroxylase superfamily)
MDDILHALQYLEIAGGIFVTMIIVERAHLFRFDRALTVRDVLEILSNVSTGALYKLVDGIAVATFLTYFYDDVAKLGPQFNFQNSVVGVAVLFVVSDLAFYIIHWGMHKTRYGWSSHVTHHSSTRFNLSTALRQNFLFDLSGVAILWCLPLALIGFDKMSAVVAIELNLFYQFFLHTEVVRRLPAWFEAIFNTPSHHRVHHGDVPVQLESNFGGVLIVWDRLFGTFLPEAAAGTINYGIAHRRPQTLNPLRLNLDEWFGMWGDVWRYRDVRILWKHPDWVEYSYRLYQSKAAIQTAAHEREGDASASRYRMSAPTR